MKVDTRNLRFNNLTAELETLGFELRENLGGLLLKYHRVVVLNDYTKEHQYLVVDFVQNSVLMESKIVALNYPEQPYQACFMDDKLLNIIGRYL